MRRTYLVYAVFLAALLLAALLAVSMLRSGDVSAALSRLGGGEGDYQEARQAIVLAARNPLPQVLAFAANSRHAKRARVQALQIAGELSTQQHGDSTGLLLAPLMDDTCADIRDAACKAYARLQTLSGWSVAGRLVRDAPDSATLVTAYAALCGSAEALGVRLASALQRRDSLAIDSCVTLLDSFPARKGRFYQDLASYYRRNGDLRRAASFSSRLGLVRAWWALGAFDNPRQEGFDRDFGPESRAFNPADSFAVSDTQRAGWFSVRVANANGQLDVRQLFLRQVRCLAYFFTWVHSPDEREARLYIGSDDGPKVFCNGRLVWANKMYRGTVPDDDVVRVRLHKGVNALLVKLPQEMGGWEVVCRITDANGDGMADVFASLSPQGARDLAAAAVERAATPAALRQVADSLNVDDAAVMGYLAAAIADSSRSEPQRLTAVQLLAAANRRRLTPAGEEQLAALVLQHVRSNRPSVLLVAAGEALADMQSPKGLEPGRMLCASADQALRGLGRRLVAGYCRSRLAVQGNLTDKVRRPAIAAVVAEVESLRCVDPWVLNRLAVYHGACGDSTHAANLLTSISMPSRWLYHALTVAQGRSAAPLAAFAELTPRAEAFAATGRDAPLGWQWAGGAGVPIAELGIPDDHYGRKQDDFVLWAEVQSPRSASLRLAVSMPGQYRVWLNGSLLGASGEEDASRYAALQGDGWMQEEFDVSSFGAVVRPGANRIAIVFSGMWYYFDGGRYFRAAFIAPDGAPVGCAGNRLAL